MTKEERKSIYKAVGEFLKVVEDIENDSEARDSIRRKLRAIVEYTQQDAALHERKIGGR